MVLSLVFTPVLLQVEIKQKSEYITQPHDDTQLTKEIYTSMYELSMFYEKEKVYIEDLKAIQVN